MPIQATKDDIEVLLDQAASEVQEIDDDLDTLSGMSSISDSQSVTAFEKLLARQKKIVKGLARLIKLIKQLHS